MSGQASIKYIFFSLLLFNVLSCNSSHPKDDQKYKAQIDTWHQKRVDNLTKDDSWLSLAGLYWLDEGKNTFGSDSTNDIVFPKNKAPEKMGEITLKDSSVSVSISPHITVTANGKKISNSELKPDVSGQTTILHHGSLSWYIIKRGDRFGVRLKDRKNAALKNFNGIKRYPVDEKWRAKATFVSFDSARQINIPTILGQPANVTVPGDLEFKLKGKSYKILPIAEEGNSDQWFIVFGDETNGNETYGGGRFIYVDKPSSGNTTYVDFNKAYNPPCAFTTFATCPLPPPENKLPISIKAGEKNYGEHHHSR